ncbi:MAG: energy transducer TonB [Muribaculaceae bacterium]|nr:energy transducer TonB [Muribaculaceae bacterium]
MRKFSHLASSIIVASALVTFSMSAQAPGGACVQRTRVVTTVKVYDCDNVEEQPSFPGGQCELIRFINRIRRYPSAAYSDGVQGRVLVSFVVNTDGSLSHLRVVRGVEASLDQEALRVVGEMPAWEPGRIDDHPVPTHCLLPIPFRR